MLKITGDFSALRDLERRFGDATDLMRKASKAMAEETVDLVKDGYRTETDPYGDKWAPKLANDGRKTLSGKTSRLKGGWRVEEAGPGAYTVSSSVDYGLPHQSPRRGPGGRLKRPKRMQVPEPSKGLPSKWADALEETASDTVRAHFGKG